MGDDDQGHLELEDKALDSKPPRKSRGRNGRGGGRGGGHQSREVQVSKALSRLLRHQAENAGIKLDRDGYAPLDEVLAYGPIRSLGVTLADVQTAVSDNDKQRFSLKPKDGSTGSDATDFLIRANQGHSIKTVESSSLLVPLTLDGGEGPGRVVHGTYFAFWPAIVASGGLRPMGRNHVHCSRGTPEEGVVSGMRRDAELLVEIDVERSIAEGGLKWWRSDNDVILTEGDPENGGLLSSRFFRLVRGRRDEVGVLWENGEWVADLPEGLKVRVPHGKGPRGGGGRGGRGERGGRGRG
ncbi:tRNA 2'-phosphotransferase-like protein [Hapsidospora chrysogenum ATCC 11550]|uniref:2'-phosphotransferase n=1 Tax=Hapsidospora chrysogenum (strain ATCC 11550 / CBS 779.69 / DSM 880 / IAM 14645 / JCM 23072 / IMI 49137) TaxID=857340 RepID=A0A086TFF5_HAPC1|nr:tRNA 2'-phosphotransferase-like protein [Hapsidospora chrysogenum ATCC 11550]